MEPVAAPLTLRTHPHPTPLFAPRPAALTWDLRPALPPNRKPHPGTPLHTPPAELTWNLRDRHFLQTVRAVEEHLAKRVGAPPKLVGGWVGGRGTSTGGGWGTSTEGGLCAHVWWRCYGRWRWRWCCGTAVNGFGS